MFTLTKTELTEKYSISRNAWERRHTDLLEHLKDFMDITEYKSDTGRYIYEIKDDQLPTYIPPLPRKSKMAQKKKDYENYTIASLGTEYKYNSMAKVAREAIKDFGYDKYGHKSQKHISERYISKPFKEHGVSLNNSQHWVWYETYEEMSPEVIEDWRAIMQEQKIGEKEQASAFRDYANGEDISEQVGFYKAALDIFREKYHDIPVKVKKWRNGDSAF